ncbi:cupin domain-containing protein [Sphaerochaeta globosa]
MSGRGKALCNGEEESLSAGVCYVCHKGSRHSIVNKGDEDFIILTVVVER